MRSTWLGSLLIFAIGCSSSGPRKLVDNAVLAAVSEDHSYLAYYTGPTMLPDDAITGSLSVEKIGGAPIKLADGAFGATFNRSGDTLWFATNPQKSTDPNSTTIYGTLQIWTPNLSAPVAITSGLSILDASPPDGSFVISFDAPMPMARQMGNVVLARASDCDGTACKPIMLASNVECTGVQISQDGRFAAYAITSGTGAAAEHQAWLVNVATGAATMIAQSTLAEPIALSPDGNLFATTKEVAMAQLKLPLQLAVFSTSSMQEVTWAAQPAMTGSVQLAFTDASTLILRTQALQGASTIYKTTAGAATMLGPGKFFAIQHVPAAAARWVFVSQNGTNVLEPPYDVSVYDSTAATPTATMLATAGTLPSVSDDGTQARFLDMFDATALTGNLMVSTLPAAPQMVASGVTEGASAFALGSDELYWLDAIGGTGSMNEWLNGKTKVVAKNVYDFRTRDMPATIWYAITAADPITGVSAPGIYQIPAPTP